MFYSFDIFDTLITRKTATPRGIFAIMQKYLMVSREFDTIPQYFKDNFFQLRIYAENLARQSALTKPDKEEITLEEIYNGLLLTGSITKEEAMNIQKLEISTEYEFSIPIEENIRKLKEIYKSNNKIVLISDMYLDTKIIRKILLKHDVIFENINMYISSEYKKQKSTGNLFSIVQEIEQIDICKWVHIGNDKIADIMGAKKIGITAKIYHYPDFMQFEKVYLENAENDINIQLLIGGTRNLRICNIREKPFQIGASFGGILIFSYVQWVIKESLRKDIQHLYFVARDGYILKIVADIIIQSFSLPLKTDYIYGSRKAWRMACFLENLTDIEQLIYYTDMEEINNIEVIAQIFQISSEELKMFLDSIQQEYTIKEVRKIAGKLNKCTEFRKFLSKKHENKRNILKKYLLQQIDYNEKSAFVEVSGSGMTQTLIRSLMSEMRYNLMPTFFMRIISTNFFDDQIWVYMPQFSDNGFLSEAFCRAPHGLTIGYKQEREKIVPVIDEAEVIYLKECGYDEYINGVKVFAKAIINELKENKHKISFEKIYLKSYYYISNDLDEEILDFIGEVPLKVTGEGNKVVRLAPILLDVELEQIFLVRTYEPINFFYKGSSLEGSVKRCTKKQMKKIEYYMHHANDIIGNTIKKKYHNSVMPFLERPLFMKEKIILYAAGNWGQKYYWKLKDTRNVKIVAWVDMDYKKYQALGLEVENIDVLYTYNYDQILICVKDEILAESIKSDLLKKGLASEKIYWIKG